MQMQLYNSPDRAIMAQWHDKARQWFARAADQGLAEAQLQLGLMYATGQATQRIERNLAMSW